MNTIRFPDYDKPLIIEDLYVYLKLSEYASQNKTNQERFAQQRTIQMLQESNLPEDEKLKRLHESLRELTSMTVSKITDYIDFIVTDTGEKITNRDWIHEFILNAEQSIYQKIREGITAKNAEYEISDIDVECPSCHAKSKRKFLFDPASFFGRGS